MALLSPLEAALAASAFIILVAPFSWVHYVSWFILISFPASFFGGEITPTSVLITVVAMSFLFGRLVVLEVNEALAEAENEDAAASIEARVGADDRAWEPRNLYQFSPGHLNWPAVAEEILAAADDPADCAQRVRNRFHDHYGYRPGRDEFRDFMIALDRAYRIHQADDPRPNPQNHNELAAAADRQPQPRPVPDPQPNQLWPPRDAFANDPDE